MAASCCSAEVGACCCGGGGGCGGGGVGVGGGGGSAGADVAAAVGAGVAEAVEGAAAGADMDSVPLAAGVCVGAVLVGLGALRSAALWVRRRGITNRQGTSSAPVIKRAGCGHGCSRAAPAACSGECRFAC